MQDLDEFQCDPGFRSSTDTKINEGVNQILRICDLNNYLKRWKIDGILTFLSQPFVLIIACFPVKKKLLIFIFFKHNCTLIERDRPSTHWHNKQTNSLTGGSCEAAVGSTGVVFDNNAWSLCSLWHWASCFHFSSAQLSANTSYSHKCTSIHAHTSDICGCRLSRMLLHDYYKLWLNRYDTAVMRVWTCVCRVLEMTN